MANAYRRCFRHQFTLAGGHTQFRDNVIRHNTANAQMSSVAGNIGSYQGGGMAFAVSAPKRITGTLVHNTFAANNQGSGEGQSAIQIDDPRVSLILTNNSVDISEPF